MFLGITAKWRGQPLRLCLPIPRALLSSRQRLVELPLALRHGLSTLPTTTDSDASTKSEAIAEDQHDHSEAITRVTESIPAWNPRNTPDFDDLAWAAASRSVFVKPAQQLPNRRQMRDSQREHHKSVIRQIRNVDYAEHIQAQPVDWRHIQSLLLQITEVEELDWIDNGMKITLSRALAREMLGDAGDYTIAAIRRRTKGIIAIPVDDPVHTTEPSTEDASAESTLFVSGSRKAINSVVDQIRRAAGKLTITRLYSPLAPEEREVETYNKIVDETLSEAENRDFSDALRSGRLLTTPLTRAEGTHAPRRWIDHHVNLTSMPSTWTTATFEDYVKDLVDSKIARHLHSRTYTSRKGETLLDHQQAVTNRLHDLFDIAPAVLVASCSALKIALNYICARGPRHFPDALKLVGTMERRGFRLDTQLFNTLLLATVKMANTNRFAALVKRMQRGGYKADLDTWLIFLRMTQSREHRSHILHSLQSKNLLATPEALRRVAEEMAAFDVESAIAEGKDLKSFLEEQDRRYGSTWLTRAAGNSVIDVLCSHKCFDEAFDMLDRMSDNFLSIPCERTEERRAARPDAIGYNIILSHAQTLNRMALAVNVQRKLSRSHALARHFDPTPLDLLFEIAWKSRLRSSMVVIWRYASLARVTSWRMRQRVADLLHGKSGSGKFGMTQSVHRALGGETLARELAGGPKALARIRSLAEMMVGTENQHLYRAKLAALTAQAIPIAFSGRFPALEPGEVLAQSMMVDIKCLGARKQGKLSDLLSMATIKQLPLIEDRRVHSRVWVDFGPAAGISVQRIEDGDPLALPYFKNIRPTDIWEDRWESEGWTLDTREMHQSSHIAIINPRVWADDSIGNDMASLDLESRTDLQVQNEEAMLAALDELKAMRPKPRKGADRQNEEEMERDQNRIKHSDQAFRLMRSK